MSFTENRNLADVNNEESGRAREGSCTYPSMPGISNYSA